MRGQDGNAVLSIRSVGGMFVWLCFVMPCLAISGCVTDVANRYYSSERYPPKNIEEVEILQQPPARPHEIIADFQSRGENARDLQKKAAKIGADAVIVQYLGGQVREGAEWVGEASNGTYTRITGTAIRYR
jgi:hypothetical protein